MGVFRVKIEIGDPSGQRFESVDAVVDTGASYSQAPKSLLNRLNVKPHIEEPLVTADGREVPSQIGIAYIRINGTSLPSLVVFEEETAPVILGAHALEGFLLGVDPVAKRLIPVRGYRLARKKKAGIENINNSLTICCTINGKSFEENVPSGATLLEWLRYQLRLSGTKEGCGEGECGACTVLVNNRPVNSCMMMAVQANGCDIVTVEGLADRWGEELHPVQEGFIDKGGVQCGFCIPGMVVSAVATLEKCPEANLDEIKMGLSGNLCRCTGYEKIFQAVEQAREKMRSRVKSVPSFGGKKKAPERPLPRRKPELVKV